MTQDIYQTKLSQWATDLLTQQDPPRPTAGVNKKATTKREGLVWMQVPDEGFRFQYERLISDHHDSDHESQTGGIFPGQPTMAISITRATWEELVGAVGSLSR